ncbi:acyltransferase family protein [Neorhizobium galegae]|uniref:acyltransferase family protein n=1 Tax=Neorhizobium galegae TaxID=399 RepID=UPI002105487D|nr:acyltransferase [Neorhizobium galegae]MCQ1837217.1 acyltransferase [Neorhizobium galegae]
MTAPKMPRLLNLDILRLVSALMVLTFHYGFRMRISGEGGGIGFPELAPLAMWFDTGLLIFFAISGYVITMSAEGRSAYDFAAGRFARLWPTFIVCATITAVVLAVWHVPTLDPPTVRQWLAHGVIISRGLGQPFLDGAYWTIAYEIIFYGWVFLLIATGLFERGWRVVVLAWLAISIVNEALIGSGAIQKLLITEYSGYFAFGLALYKVRQHASLSSLCVLAAAVCWAIATPFLTEPDFIATYGLSRSAVGLALIGPLALAAVAVCATAPSLRISQTLAIGLGGLTYPLYLLHQNIGYAVFARFGTEQNRWLVALVLVAALLFAAWVIARTVEPAARRAIIRAAGHLRDGLGRLRQRTA